MKRNFDIGDFVEVATPQSIILSIKERAKIRRKSLKISQKKLAERSGVSYASVRRFEKTGEISLISLINIADTLGCTEDFNFLFGKKIITNLKDFNE